MVEVFQVLDENGIANPERDPKLPDEDLRKLYRTMLLNRLFDQRMMTLQRQGRIGFYLASTGEEATNVGSAYALRDSDIIFPCYREPGAFLWREVPLLTLVSQCMGNEIDLVKGRQMPVHYSAKAQKFVSISSPVGTQIPQAVGAAWAAKIAKKDDVVLVYFGDGSTSQGDFHVGANFAGVFKVPAILLCRNNGYAISTDFSRQTASGSIVVKAMAYGIRGIRLDGNDILAVIAATQDAAKRARDGEGTTLIESVTYRAGAHSSSDDPSVYRKEGEDEEWAKKDPLQRFVVYLKKRDLWDDASMGESLEETLKEEIAQAIRESEKSNPPQLASIFDDVYEKLPWNLEEQKQELLDAKQQSETATQTNRSTATR